MGKKNPRECEDFLFLFNDLLCVKLVNLFFILSKDRLALHLEGRSQTSVIYREFLGIDDDLLHLFPLTEAGIRFLNIFPYAIAYLLVLSHFFNGGKLDVVT